MTTMFVSHTLEDVELLCASVAVLHQGELVGTSSPPYRTRMLRTRQGTIDCER